MVDYSMNGYDWPLICKTGSEQSPINLKTKFASTSTFLAIRAKDFETISSGTMRKTATHMALDLYNGQFDIIDPMGGYTEYTPYEAIVRSPSEHTVDGLTYDAEL
jgi:carbonic anhydrase